MAPKAALKVLLLISAVGTAVILMWGAWVVSSSYLRTPRLVSELQQAGALDFSPTDLPRNRLCARLPVFASGGGAAENCCGTGGAVSRGREFVGTTRISTFAESAGSHPWFSGPESDGPAI